MPATSSEAIGAVSDLLSARLSSALNNLPVPVGRPHLVGEQRALNLFLYNIALDPHLRNEPLDRGQPPPLWLVLHYLLTAFDLHGESDSVAALKLLGQGMAALHELNFVRPPVTNLWLAKNPEPLKITFEEAGADLLSKLMQGGEEERFRVSAAVQVRPVMLGIETAPAYAPLVTSVGPPAKPGVMVLPSMGARLLSVEPQRFVAGTAVTLTGLDLGGYDEVLLGANSLPVSPGTVEGTVSFTVPDAAAISANAYPVCVARTLASGRKLKSNALLAELMPRVSGVALDGTLTQLPPPGPNALRHGRFSVSGLQLGGADASALAALYRDGTAQGPFEADAGATTTQMLFTVPAGKALAPGNYQVIVRVNGQQAAASPVLSWV